MIDIHSKYDNMHKNVMFYVLCFINNNVIISLNCMLSITCVAFQILNSINNSQNLLTE